MRYAFRKILVFLREAQKTTCFHYKSSSKTGMKGKRKENKLKKQPVKETEDKEHRLEGEYRSKFENENT